jgi:PTS system nitrogen regulatory IIA component
VSGVKLSDFLAEGVIIPDLRSRKAGSSLQEMVDFLKKTNRVVEDQELYARLLEREKLGSTAIGEGVAIPHCKFAGLINPLVILGVSRNGVDFESVDGKPVHIFFLVIAAPDDPGTSLQILASIARLVRKAGALDKKILQAASPRLMLEVIRREEQKLDE